MAEIDDDAAQAAALAAAQEAAAKAAADAAALAARQQDPDPNNGTFDRSKLSLRGKLTYNYAVHNKNAEKEAKAIGRALRAPQPDDSPPGSPAADYIPMSLDDMRALKEPAVVKLFEGIIPDYLVLELAKDRNILEEASALKRKDSSDPIDPMKRRRRNGAGAVEVAMGDQLLIEFPQILFDTDVHYPVPLPFFTNKNLRYIYDKGTSLPRIKASVDKTQILNVKEIALVLNDELSLDCVDYFEAADNYFRFQRQCDVVEDEGGGEWTHFFAEHFRFFETQVDKNSLYPAWKHLELKMRQDHLTFNMKFNLASYSLQFELCRNKWESTEAFRLYASQNSAGSSSLSDYAASRGSPSARGGKPSSFSRGSKRGGGNAPSRGTPRSFPAGSSRSGLPTCCILCGERGHGFGLHLSGTAPTLFADGSSIWAKVKDRNFCTPDGRSMCINFNVRGRDHVCTDPSRAHNCSFCGSETHHAFSWSCRPSPAI